jgi:hypothetical protein
MSYRPLQKCNLCGDALDVYEESGNHRDCEEYEAAQAALAVDGPCEPRLYAPERESLGTQAAREGGV